MFEEVVAGALLTTGRCARFRRRGWLLRNTDISKRSSFKKEEMAALTSSSSAMKLAASGLVDGAPTPRLCEVIALGPVGMIARAFGPAEGAETCVVVDPP